MKFEGNTSDLRILGSNPEPFPLRVTDSKYMVDRSKIGFPKFNPMLVTSLATEQRYTLDYSYFPGGKTPHEAFNLEADELQKFLEDLVNMALDFRHNNSGGDFLRVDAANRLLKNRSDGGNILMFFAWQPIEELVGDSIDKALVGTLFDERPSQN